MLEAAVSERERAYADAEQRLGRPLFPGERVVDVPSINGALARAKDKLTEAIEVEKRFVIGERSRGWMAYPEVTGEMVKILVNLYREGQRLASLELAEMGVGKVRAFADWPFWPPGLREIFDWLKAMLAGYGVRITTEEDKIRFSGLEPEVSPLTEKFLDMLDDRIPGAKDIASRVVSSTLLAGVADVYHERRDLFPCFVVTAILDANTCLPCRQDDGSRFETAEEAQAVMDNQGWGPNKRCLGDGRCRCRLVPCLPGEGGGSV